MLFISINWKSAATSVYTATCTRVASRWSCDEADLGGAIARSGRVARWGDDCVRSGEAWTTRSRAGPPAASTASRLPRAHRRGHDERFSYHSRVGIRDAIQRAAVVS